MSPALLSMYLLSVIVRVGSFFVSRGPDGRFTAFFVLFGLIAVAYVALSWMMRQQPIWPHLGAHLLLFLGGMPPKPRLDEMAGMMYLFAPAAIVGMILLGSITRALAGWL